MALVKKKKRPRGFGTVESQGDIARLCREANELFARAGPRLSIAAPMGRIAEDMIRSHVRGHLSAIRQGGNAIHSRNGVSLHTEGRGDNTEVEAIATKKESKNGSLNGGAETTEVITISSDSERSAKKDEISSSADSGTENGNAAENLKPVHRSESRMFPQQEILQNGKWNGASRENNDADHDEESGDAESADAIESDSEGFYYRTEYRKRARPEAHGPSRADAGTSTDHIDELIVIEDSSEESHHSSRETRKRARASVQSPSESSITERRSSRRVTTRRSVRTSMPVNSRDSSDHSDISNALNPARSESSESSLETAHNSLEGFRRLAMNKKIPVLRKAKVRAMQAAARASDEGADGESSLDSSDAIFDSSSSLVRSSEPSDSDASGRVLDNESELGVRDDASDDDAGNSSNETTDSSEESTVDDEIAARVETVDDVGQIKFDKTRSGFWELSGA